MQEGTPPDAGTAPLFPNRPDNGSSIPSARQWAESQSQASTSLLRDLRPGHSIGTSFVPFRVTDRAAYLKAVKAHGSVSAKTHDAPIALVNLSDIQAIQETVNDERLNQHLEAPAGLVAPGTRGSGHGGLVDRPVVVRINGELFLHDGHHRLTAAHLRGQTTAKVRLVDLDGEYVRR